MARTTRKRPIQRESRQERLEREWERRAKAQELSRPVPDLPVQVSPPPFPAPNLAPTTPDALDDLRQEAELVVNERQGTVEEYLDSLPGEEGEKARRRVPYSIQGPASDSPVETGGGLVWWTGGKVSDYIPIGNYGDPQRIRDIRIFALVSPFILNAESVLTKKVQSLQWTIEGGRNLAQKWQKRLNNFENGDGWDFFIARWIRAYCESDKFACAELIRSAPSWAVDTSTGAAVLTPRGERAIERGDDAVWEIVDARVMDPVNCFPTASKEFPLIYKNSYTGQRHQLRPYQYMSLIDLPSVDDRFPGHGVCAISRAIWAAQEDRMVIRYSMEKMSENPGAGIGIINASTTALQSALRSVNAEREARGVVYYKGVVFLPVLDPSGSTKLEFLSFADLPDGFDRLEVYNIIKEVVATAFGLDILELGSIPGRLGTATQAKVAAQKGRTKTIGAIMQGVERSFRYKLLPESITFSIKKHDQDEEMQRAEIDALYFENAIRFAQFAVNPLLPTQYLADKGAIPNEPPYIEFDLTAREEVQDVQIVESVEEESEGQTQAAGAESVETGPEGAAEEDVVKRWRREGPRVKIDRDGKVTLTDPLYQAYTLQKMWRQKGAQRFAPRIGGSLPPLVPAIEPLDRSRASRLWDRLSPEYEELLEAGV